MHSVKHGVVVQAAIVRQGSAQAALGALPGHQGVDSSAGVLQRALEEAQTAKSTAKAAYEGAKKAWDESRDERSKAEAHALSSAKAAKEAHKVVQSTEIEMKSAAQGAT